MNNLISGPAWAYGCVHCTFGVKDEYYTEPTGGVELVLERLVAAERVGPAYFCDCRAGQALRKNLVDVRERFFGMHMRLGPHKGVTKNKGEVVIEHLEIGKIILSQARHTMAQPHMQAQPAPEAA